MKGFDKFGVCYRRIEDLEARILFIRPDPHTDPLVLPQCCGTVDPDFLIEHWEPGANYDLAESRSRSYLDIFYLFKY